jgi:hypothetical protein
MTINEAEKCKLIDKIRKVLALTENTNKNEAENAMLMAQKLLAENNMTIQDISPEEKKKHVLNSAVKVARRFSWWKIKLSLIIAKNFKCYTYRSKIKYINTKMCFIGLEEDVEIATDVFNYAVEVIKINYKRYIRENGYTNTRGVKNEYILGFLDGLRDKFNEQINKNNWALVIIKDPIVDEEYKKLKVREIKSTLNIQLNRNSDDREAGYKQGKNFEYISGSLEA